MLERFQNLVLVNFVFSFIEIVTANIKLPSSSAFARNEHNENLYILITVSSQKGTISNT